MFDDQLVAANKRIAYLEFELDLADAVAKHVSVCAYCGENEPKDCKRIGDQYKAWQRRAESEDPLGFIQRHHSPLEDLAEVVPEIMWLLTLLGGHTNARWDQHLRNEFGDEKANKVIASLTALQHGRAVLDGDSK